MHFYYTLFTTNLIYTKNYLNRKLIPFLNKNGLKDTTNGSITDYNIDSGQHYMGKQTNFQHYYFNKKYFANLSIPGFAIKTYSSSMKSA